MPGIGVISNPRSGQNRRNPHLVHRLAYVLGGNHELAQPTDLDDLDTVAQRLREQDIDILCIHGGDGTLHKALSAVVRAWAPGLRGRELRAVRLPLIAILKSGTVNTMARNVRVKATPEAMLGHVVSTWHSGDAFQTVERSLMVVDGAHAGFLFGTGVLSRFMEAYYEGGTTGPGKAVRVLLRTVWGAIFRTAFTRRIFAEDTVHVTTDGSVWPRDRYRAIAAGTMADLGLGFKVFSRALKHPDHIHVLGFACEAIRVSRFLPAIWLGRAINDPEVDQAVARRFTITASGPQGFMMDGDFLQAGQSIEVETGPRVRFIVL